MLLTVLGTITVQDGNTTMLPIAGNLFKAGSWHLNSLHDSLPWPALMPDRKPSRQKWAIQLTRTQGACYSLQNSRTDCRISASFGAAIRVWVILDRGWPHVTFAPGLMYLQSCECKRLKSKVNLERADGLRSLPIFFLKISWSVSTVIVLTNLATLIDIFVVLHQQKLTASWWYKTEETRCPL